MTWTLGALAEALQGHLVGESTRVVTHPASLTQADSHALTFATGDYAAHLKEVQAGCVLVEEEVEAACPLIVVANVRKAFAEAVTLLRPAPTVPIGVHPTAILGEGVQLGTDVSVGPYVVIGDQVRIGDRVVLQAGTYIGSHVSIGADSVVHPHAVVHDHCTLGARVVLRAGSVVGGAGFGFATEQGRHTHIPQIGGVVIEDDVEIGSNTCIDCGTLDPTRIRRGTKIDNLVHIAHNVDIGEDCFLVAQVGIAGSTTCGHHCIFAGQVGSTGHITIGNECTFAARTGITGHVPDGSHYAGFPMRPHRTWLKQEAYAAKVPELVKTVQNLRKEVDELKHKE